MCGGAYATDLTVGTATARPGERANGSIRVPAGSDAAVEIPVIAINGAKPGPTMALVAGAHGTEYASILALEEVAKRADPAAMSGALIVVPLLNLASFTQKVPHLNPVDGKNMNRFYPGKADGTQTERASLAITQQVVEKADYILDYHGGDLDENLRKYAYWADTGNARMDGIARGMVLAFGLDHIIIQRQSAAPGGPITLTRIAQQKGKPAIAVEAGHAGTTDAEDVEALADGTFRVMRHLKMLPGEVKAIEHPLWIARASVLASERDGIFHPLVVPEAYVTKGMRVGYVTDYFGNTVWEATAPVSGVVLYICAVPSMKKGDNVVDIGEIEP
jgi:predicted deacylase